MADLENFQNLAVAVAIGFLIGFQREWRAAEEAKTRSFAGARTFAFVALVGGLAGLVDLGPFVIVAGFIGIAALTVTAYWAEARETPGVGGTSEVALMSTYLLGALATRGDPALAAAGGVGAAILLSLKPLVQDWAKSIEEREVAAALRFLALTVIVLPILPNESFGPYEALNPREIWLLVVLISGLSFLGYWLTKFFGERGVLLTGIVGGLASSTAATLSLARLVRDGSAAPGAGAAGIVAANVVMLGRVGALLFVVAQSVFLVIWPMLVAGVVAGAAAAVYFWRTGKSTTASVTLGNPLELKTALIFAGLLAVIAVASKYAVDQFGESGLYALAFLTGLADVDAITLTAGRQAQGGAIVASAAAAAVLLAVTANIFLKTGMTIAIAGRGAGLRVLAAQAAVIAASAAALLVFGGGESAGQ